MNLLKRNKMKAGSSVGETASSFSVSPSWALPAIQSTGKLGFAFAGTYLFTLLLYLRPNELFPEIFGTLSIIKFIAISALLAYVGGKLSSGEPLTIMTIEVKMILVMVGLCLLLLPVSLNPGDSWKEFNDTFSKVVLIFILMVNLIDSRKRLLSIFNVVIAGGVWVSYFAIQMFREGTQMLQAKGISRIAGVGGGMFGNPNDLANSLDMLIPLAFVLGLSRKGIARWVYFGATGLFVVGVLITYSRGAFLGLVVTGAFLAWKLGQGKRVKMVFISVLVVGLMTAISPGGFGKRMLTILDSNKDQTGSSYQRRELLKRGVRLVVARPFGIGMNNYHVLSINEEKAHNAYIEISVELGVLGLIAYLVINIAPLLRLMRYEKEFAKGKTEQDKEAYYIGIGLQGILVAYMVCSLFASIQYFWYLYYPVAQSIAFCRIYSQRKVAASEQLALVPATAATKPAKRQTNGGVLWKEPQAGALWKAISWGGGRRISKKVSGA
ncbi:MAG: O-antigen ligase family protein [Acidobacteriota bacterium]|nr:O-antigen ligase family protein [Acidobacteriota bacterium]